MAYRFPRPTRIQTIIFDRERWSVSAAKKWLAAHGYKIPPVDTTANYHRFRQRPTFDFTKGTMRTKKFGEETGIKAVIGMPRQGKAKSNPSSKKAPASKSKRKSPVSRIPATLVDIANAMSVELDDGREIKFKLRDDFSVCCNDKGNELWILSRVGSRTVDVQDGDEYKKLFERFTGYEADNIGELVKRPSVRMVAIGRCSAILYRSDKFARAEHDYIHPFKTMPTVAVDNDAKPAVVAIRGGRIRVTAEGITG
jgi:hypothetical protein